LPVSLSSLSFLRMGLMDCIQRSFEGFLAPFRPRLEPCPDCLPFLFCAFSNSALPLETPFFCLATIVPELMSILTSARVMASETSSERFGSTQTLFTPHLRSSDAILLWFLRFIDHPLLLSTLIPSSSALTSISWRFLMPTEWATLAASSSGLIFSRSLTFHTMTSLNPDG